jgi:hypothetical protein
LLDQAQMEIDPQKRIALYKLALEIGVEQAAIAPALLVILVMDEPAQEHLPTLSTRERDWRPVFGRQLPGSSASVRIAR